MDREKTAAANQQTSYALLDGGKKATKGFAAVTQFVQPDKPKQTNGNVMPAQLKSGLEALSGLPMDDVRVNYNSPQPAQLGALAYAKGNQIHLGPGQEQHLPHEAWHVVQQKQGRVKPTLQAKGLAVNDNPALEAEADMMGQKAIQLKTAQPVPVTMPHQSSRPTTDVVQRKIGFEFQAYGCSDIKDSNDDEVGKELGKHNEHLFNIETDTGAGGNSELEIVTKAFEETSKGTTTNPAGRTLLIETMLAIDVFLKQLSAEPEFKKIKNPDITWNPDIRDARINIFRDNLHFHPQATVGVKFTKVADLIDHFTAMEFRTGSGTAPVTTAETKVHEPETKGELVETATTAATEVKSDELAKLKAAIGWSGKEDQRPFKAAWREGFNEAEEKSPAAHYPVLKGLMAILFGLAQNIKKEIRVGDGKYLKYWMPFMLRTGFKPFYDAMLPHEREALHKLVADEKLDADILPKGLEEITDRTISIADIINDLKSADNKKDLFQGEGVLGHGGITGPKEKTDHYGFGNTEETQKWDMETVSDIGISDKGKERRKGAVIELRKLGNDIKPAELKEFALAVFDLVSFINLDKPVDKLPNKGCCVIL
jgi:hypothetical protein